MGSFLNTDEVSEVCGALSAMVRYCLQAVTIDVSDKCVATVEQIVFGSFAHFRHLKHILLKKGSL